MKFSINENIGMYNEYLYELNLLWTFLNNSLLSSVFVILLIMGAILLKCFEPEIFTGEDVTISRLTFV